jgi:hypothetical protein
MASRRWLGISLATAQRFCFWRSISVKDQKANTLASHLSTVINELKTRGFITCAIVTDNAYNEQAAVREVGDIMGLPVFRIACLSHTTNLAVKDFLTDAFPRGHFSIDMGKLLSALPRALKSDQFYGIKVPCETRWLSLGEFVSSVLERSGEIKAFLTAPLHRGKFLAAAQVLEDYSFKELHECFDELDHYVKWTEREHATMTQAWLYALQIFDNLDILRQKGNRYAARFYSAFYKRLNDTADPGQLILGYLVTPDGFAWYRSLPDEERPGTLTTKPSVQSLVAPMLARFARRLATDEERFKAAWWWIITTATFPPQQSADDFWFAIGADDVLIDGEVYSCRLVADMARILTKMPVSGAEVERLFSRMRYIFGTRAQRSKDDLVEARMIIEMNLKDIPDSKELLACIEPLEKEDADSNWDLPARFGPSALVMPMGGPPDWIFAHQAPPAISGWPGLSPGTPIRPGPPVSLMSPASVPLRGLIPPPPLIRPEDLTSSGKRRSGRLTQSRLRRPLDEGAPT